MDTGSSWCVFICDSDKVMMWENEWACMCMCVLIGKSVYTLINIHFNIKGIHMHVFKGVQDWKEACMSTCGYEGLRWLSAT